MTQVYFIKMAHSGEGLERLLARVRNCGCTVTEMSARSSLDDSLYFVRLGVESDERATPGVEMLTNELAGLVDVRRVECEQ